MVSIKYIKSLELENDTLNAYFEYIYLSAINGQSKQVEDLTNKLNKPQKEQLVYFIDSEVAQEYKNKMLLALMV